MMRAFTMLLILLVTCATHAQPASEPYRRIGDMRRAAGVRVWVWRSSLPNILLTPEAREVFCGFIFQSAPEQRHDAFELTAGRVRVARKAGFLAIPCTRLNVRDNDWDDCATWLHLLGYYNELRRTIGVSGGESIAVDLEPYGRKVLPKYPSRDTESLQIALVPFLDAVASHRGPIYVWPGQHSYAASMAMLRQAGANGRAVGGRARGDTLEQRREVWRRSKLAFGRQGIGYVVRLVETELGDVRVYETLRGLGLTEAWCYVHDTANFGTPEWAGFPRDEDARGAAHGPEGKDQ